MTRQASNQTDDRRAGAVVSLLLLGVLAGGAVAISLPALRPLVPPCPFEALTGLYCPGCGSARTIAALLRGEVATALRMNALIVVLLPALAYVLVSDALWLAGVKRLPRLRLGPIGVWVLAGVVLAFWVLRNLPWTPFTWLAPG